MSEEIREARGFLYAGEFYHTKEQAMRAKVMSELDTLLGLTSGISPIDTLMKKYEKAITILNQMYNAEDLE